VEKNLLKYIKNTPNHPFQKILNISNDNNYIKSKINNKEIKIYGDNYTALEKLGREIYLLSDDNIQKNIDNYQIEVNVGNNTFCDLVSSNGNILNSVVEFKLTKGFSNTYERFIEQAFIQNESYIKKLVKNKTKTNKVSTSVIIMDVKKIIKEPEIIDKFFNSIDIQKNNIEYMLSTYGIYIKTKFYDIKENKYLENYGYSLCSTEIFYLNNNINFNNCLTKYTKNAIDAYNTITSNPNFGVSNVRIRLDPEISYNKEYLLYDIADTIFTGYKNNDIYCLNKYSKSKIYAFLKQDTIITEIKDNNVDKLIITTLNGATIDGQQSTEIPKLIVKYLSTEEINLTNKGKIIKNNLIKKLNNPSKKDLKDLINFIYKLTFNYELRQIKTLEEVYNLAYSANNSIELENEDTFFITHSGKFRFLSNKMHEEKNILLTYPNVRKKLSKNTIKIAAVLELYEFTLKIKKTQSYLILFINAKKHNKFIINEKNFKILNTIVETDKLINKESENKINNINNELLKLTVLKEKNNKRKNKLKKDIKEKNNIELLNYLNEELENINIELENVNNKIKNYEKTIENINKKNTKFFKLCNEEILNDLEIIIIFWKKILNFIKNDSFFKGKIMWGHIIYAFLIKKNHINNITDLNKITNDNIIYIINKLKNIFENYNLRITDINNIKTEEAKLMILINNKTNKKNNLFNLFENF